MRSGSKLSAAALVCLLLVILTIPAAEAGRKKRHERVVEDTYATPAAVVEVADGGAYACAFGGSAGNLGCVDIPVKPTERFLELEITDATGLPAPAWVVQEGTDMGGPVCGGTEEAMRIAPGVLITVWIYPYMAAPLCQGVSTTGTVTATLSNRP